MKKMLRIAAALAALLAMTNFIGCKNDDDDDGDVAVTEVKITSTVKEVTAGETIILEATVSPENATDKTVTWTSDNNEVATDKDGGITGVKAGEATITASAGGKNATVKVTVKVAATSGGETTTIAVTEVKITSTVTEVTAGETITLTAEVSPADATDKTVTWTSADTAIATVDSTGKVTGVAAGTVKITAKAGEKTAEVDVTVKAAATRGGETGGSTGGTTGGETGGSTGGTTGGETGGSAGGETGGETGTTTGFENTYWVLEEKVSEFSGMKVTLQNFKYVYINDSTSGLVYMPDTDTAVEELAKAGGGKRTVAYGEVTGNAFTYTVEGKNIILTATIEGKTETLTGTIVDENTLRFTNNADVDPFEFTLKKAAAAPTEATVTVEITAVPSETHTLDANSITLFAAGAKTDGAEEALDD